MASMFSQIRSRPLQLIVLTVWDKHLAYVSVPQDQDITDLMADQPCAVNQDSFHNKCQPVLGKEMIHVPWT